MGPRYSYRNKVAFYFVYTVPWTFQEPPEDKDGVDGPDGVGGRLGLLLMAHDMLNDWNSF